MPDNPKQPKSPSWSGGENRAVKPAASQQPRQQAQTGQPSWSQQPNQAPVQAYAPPAPQQRQAPWGQSLIGSPAQSAFGGVRSPDGAPASAAPQQIANKLSPSEMGDVQRMASNGDFQGIASALSNNPAVSQFVAMIPEFIKWIQSAAGTGEGHQKTNALAFDDPASLLAQKVATIRGFSVSGADSSQGDLPAGHEGEIPGAPTVDDAPPTSGGTGRKARPLAGNKNPQTQYPHSGADDGEIAVPDITLEPIKVASAGILDAADYLRARLQKAAADAGMSTPPAKPSFSAAPAPSASPAIPSHAPETASYSTRRPLPGGSNPNTTAATSTSPRTTIPQSI